VLGKDIALGGLHDADSAAHVMDGVLIHDWIAAGWSAWRDPMGFAVEQYGHYPTLGIGQHYPPGFAAVEAVFFAVLGISAATARLCVLFFGFLAVAGTYIFLKPLTDRTTAALAAAAWLTMPATTLWGRQTMLEIPTVAILIWGAVAFAAYIRRPTWGRYVALLLVALSAVLFKQTGVFLVCAIALTLLVGAARGSIRRGQAFGAFAVAGAAVLVVVLSFDDACLKTLSGYRTFTDPWDRHALGFYVTTLPYQTGFCVLGLSAMGMMLSRRTLEIHWVFLLGWVVVCFVMVTTASLKVPRFFYVGLFPLVVWTAIAVNRLLQMVLADRVRLAFCSSAVVALCVVAFLRPVHDSPDYGPLVAAHRGRIDGRVVLFSGLRDGDFVFAVRQQLPWREAVVIRGSKLLYTCTAGPDLDLVPHVASAGELTNLMRRFAFEHVFVERPNLVGTPQDHWLREYLADSGDYEHVDAYPLLAGARPGAHDLIVDVYSLARPLTRTVDHFDIPIPRTGRSVRVDLTAERKSRESRS